MSIRPLTMNDIPAIDRISLGSPWTALHFTPDELARLVATRPGIGVFDEAEQTMRAFLLANSVVAPNGWLGGFGVPWQERTNAMDLLDLALPPWLDLLTQREVRTVNYSGHDTANDWLYEPLQSRGFMPVAALRSYDKIGVAIPDEGNQSISIRDFDPDRDMAGVLAIERAAFAQLWQHDEMEFRELHASYPFFVVATDTTGEIVGYQYSAVDGDIGFLVRIAVAPSQHRHGVGTRLMAEVMHYFAAHHAQRILLNADEINIRAHALYERFGFELIEPRGFVLACELHHA